MTCPTAVKRLRGATLWTGSRRCTNVAAMKLGWLIVILLLELLAPLLTAQPPVTPTSPEATGPTSSLSSPSSSMDNLPPAYTLEHTEVLTIHAAKMDRDYQLFVSLPLSYSREPDHLFPVVFVTDADYAFPVLRSLVWRLNDHGHGLEEAVIVGLSYAVGETPEYSHRRDYTPTPNGDKDAVSDMPGRPVIYGGAEAYRQFIEDEVFPLVAQHYRVDMRRKIYMGFSYGGLFGAYCLLTEPTMFEHYVLGSPSLWFDHKVMLARAQSYAQTHQDLSADVYIAVGGYETLKPQSHDRHYQHSDDLVRDAQAFVEILTSRHDLGLKMRVQVFDGEDHQTMAPIVFTHGLLHALKPAQ